MPSTGDNLQDLSMQVIQIINWVSGINLLQDRLRVNIVKKRHYSCVLTLKKKKSGSIAQNTGFYQIYNFVKKTLKSPEVKKSASFLNFLKK